MPRNGPPTRRQALTALAGGIGLLTLPRSALAGTDDEAVASLGEIAARRGVLFGTAISADTLSDPAQAALYTHHARVFTTDYAFKLGALRPQEGPADFAAADALVAFAEANGIPIRAHTLIWNEWNPEWVKKLSAARAAYWLDRHVDEVVGRYAGKIQWWDVVNEPLWPQHGNADGMRNGPWYAAMGRDYVVRALKRARSADPGARIAINEAGPEWEDAWGPSKPFREGLLKLVDDAQAGGVRLDGVGLQCHWFPEFKFDADEFRGYLTALAARGVAISLSEIDVNDARMPGGPADRDAAVAARYKALISTALQEPKVEALITWQLTDRASWLMSTPSLWGTHGERPRPLPFDAALKPKAAYHAIVEALAP